MLAAKVNPLEIAGCKQLSYLSYLWFKTWKSSKLERYSLVIKMKLIITADMENAKMGRVETKDKMDFKNSVSSRFSIHISYPVDTLVCI